MPKLLITDELKSKGLPIPPAVMGKAQEIIVQDYKKNPTPEKLMYVLSMCERFILKNYELLKYPGEFDDFYQSCIERCMKIIKDYKPEKGFFGRWVSLSLEGHAKTLRGKLKRDLKMFPSTDFREYGINENYIENYDVYAASINYAAFDQQEDRDSTLSFAAIHELLDALVIRFCTQPEINICRFCIDYLKLKLRWPTLKLVCDTFCKPMEISVDDCYFSFGYVKVATHLHFLRYGKALSRGHHAKE